MLRFILILIISLISCSNLYGSDWYCDPNNGNTITGFGTKTNPWGTLQSVWESGKISTQYYQTPYNQSSPVLIAKNADGVVQPGDTIHLISGYHGELVIANAINRDWITIKADVGQQPQLRRISMTSASKWIFDGISISLSHAQTFNKEKLVFITDHDYTGPSDNIIVKNCLLFDSDNVSSWTAFEWQENTSHGIYVYGADHVIIDNCELRHLGFGITIYDAPYCEVTNNNIHHNCFDGIRVAGSNYTKVNYNYVHDLMSTDILVHPDTPNHYDAIQFWVINGQHQIGIEIIGNKIIRKTDPDLKFDSSIQGIGCFDGFYEDFIIANNIVNTPGTTHGITLTGAINCAIIYNTVINSNIHIYDKKTGEDGKDNVILNNITTGYSSCDINNQGGCKSDIKFNDLMYITDLNKYFVDPDNNDYRLKRNTEATDSGIPIPSMDIDILKNKRTDTQDLGAYENFIITTPTPKNFSIN